MKKKKHYLLPLPTLPLYSLKSVFCCKLVTASTDLCKLSFFLGTISFSSSTPLVVVHCCRLFFFAFSWANFLYRLEFLHLVHALLSGLKNRVTPGSFISRSCIICKIKCEMWSVPEMAEMAEMGRMHGGCSAKKNSMRIFKMWYGLTLIFPYQHDQDN